MNITENKQSEVESITDREDEVRPNDGERFAPVISKITKPLKPQGIHAGRVTIAVRGNF
jgi:hypothetical protein